MRAAIFVCAVSVLAQPADTVDVARAHRVVEATARTIAAEYFDARVGEQTRAALLDRLATGRYDTPAPARGLAAAVTRDLFEITHDKHLALTVAPPPTPTSPPPRDTSPPTQLLTPREIAGRRANFGVRRVEILPGNVGLLDITNFFRANEAADAIASAMRLLQYADSLILDLRDNAGGSPETVALLCGYLFDTPATPLFDIVSRDGQRTTYATADVTPRNGGRPIYALTSSHTFSAGEGLAFLLQETGRATVIGEQTPGAANPGRPYRVGDGFEVVVPNGQVRAAKSGGNWEGSGVTPDVRAAANDALAVARERAQLSSPKRGAVRRFDQNPLLTVSSSPTLGGNVNGPTVIHVPSWIEHPLGRYYMYFANHMGDFVRLAYADALTGPWKVYEPGVLHARATAFFREQPDPPEALDDFYTHVASPEIYVDSEHRRLVMWVHGWWTNGERWPPTLQAARQWARQKGYGQFTQAAESEDGLHFTVRPSISKTSYLRVFQHRGAWYGVSRLGRVSRSIDPLASFEPIGNLFTGTPHAGKVRHVALVPGDDRLTVFFTRIGDAPEHVMMATVPLAGEPGGWRAGPAVDVLAPGAKYECTDLPDAPSDAGDINVAAKQIRDPFVYQEDGRKYLFYSTCGEQGIAAAELGDF